MLDSERDVYNTGMSSRPGARRRLGLAAILTGITASVLMQTLLATAMPQVVAELGGDHLYGWVFASYLLASTVPLPAFAQLADRVGRRPLFLLGMGGYAAGTALSALAISMETLVAARVVQGLGAGALVPAALAGIADLAPGEAKGRLFGLVGVIQVLGNIAGPLLGGFFADGPGWRWGLWAVVPVALAAGGLAAAGLPRGPGRGWTAALRRIDWVQPLRLVRADPAVRSVSTGAFLLGIALMSATAYLPLLVQGVFGRTATESSAVLIPLMVGVGVGSMLGGQLAARHGRAALLLAWGLAASAFAALAVIASGAAGLAAAAAASAVAGVGIGTVQPVLLVRAQDDAAADQTASVSAMVQLFRNLGGAVGTALLGLVITGMSLVAGLAWVFAVLAGTAAVGVVVSSGPGARRGPPRPSGRG